MRIVRNKGYGQSPVRMIKIIIPFPSQLGRIGKFILHQPSQWKTTRRSLTSSPTQYGKIWKSSIQHQRILFLLHLRHQRRQRRCGARRTRRHRPQLLLQVRTKRPRPDQVWRKILLFDPKPRASLGEVPPLSQRE